MKKLLAILILSVSAFATTTVTGNMNTLGGSASSGGSFMRFWLRGCAGNQPRITGIAVVAPSQGGVYFFDIPANNGVVSGTLYSTRDSSGNGNGEIECGGSYTSEWYGMQAFVNGKGGPEVPVAAKNSATLDISTVTPITVNPVVIAPTGDTTYARLDGGNQPFTGSVSPSGNGTLNMGFANNRWKFFGSTLDISGNSTQTGNVTVGGNETIGGTLGVTGNTTIGGTLGVTGVSTLTGGILSPSLSSIGTGSLAILTPNQGGADAGSISITGGQGGGGNFGGSITLTTGASTIGGKGGNINLNLGVSGSGLGKILTNSIVSQYNNISTAGVGLPPIYGATAQKPETQAADANVLTYTPPATIGTYRISVTASVASATTGVISFTASWKDSNGNTQTNLAMPLFQLGTAAPNTTFTTSAAGNYSGGMLIDVDNSATAIVIKWVGGGTSVAKVSATIEQLQ